VERLILEGDAFELLPGLPPHNTIVTSLPDAADLDWPIPAWQSWFLEAARLCLEVTPGDGLTVFYQTDRKHGGEWISKAGLLLGLGRRLLWHKTVLRRPAGSKSIYRPGYAHLLAFSETGTVGRPSADVIPPSRSESPDGMPGAVISYLLPYALRFGPAICDPFCGLAPLLARAEHMPFARITGIEINPAVAEAARAL